MSIEGNIIKMRTEIGTPIQYYLSIGETELCMNDYIGKPVRFSFAGQINCIHCGKKTKTSFGQGFCYNCFQTAPQADQNVMKPELSRAQWGEARDLEWAMKHDMIEHVVYLAVSSDLKVGVTRHTQVPTRWIDQGASRAIVLARTPNRHIAGVIEVALKAYVADKTNWRAMLKNEVNEEIQLVEAKAEMKEKLHLELQQYVTDETEIVDLDYPVLAKNVYPKKITSMSFDKMEVIEGTLKAIKGQYLILDTGVVNVRKHNGYFVSFVSEQRELTLF